MTRRPKLGLLYKRFHAEFHARFLSAASELGFKGQFPDRQWSALGQVCAFTGTAPDRISAGQLTSGCELVIDAASRLRSKEAGHNIASAAFGLEATLFYLDVIEGVVTTKHRRTRARSRAEKWAGIPAELAATFLHYLDQMTISMRPTTIERYEVWLRAFVGVRSMRSPTRTSTTSGPITSARPKQFPTDGSIPWRVVTGSILGANRWIRAKLSNTRAERSH